MTTMHDRTALRARSVGVFATLLLAGAALTGCSGATGSPATAAAPAATAASDDGGATPAPETSTAPSAATTSSGDATHSATAGSSASTSYLNEPGPAQPGVFEVDGGYAILTEPLSADSATTEVRESDGFTVQSGRT